MIRVMSAFLLLVLAAGARPARAEDDALLRARVEQLEKRLAELEKGLAPSTTAAPATAAAPAVAQPFDFADFTWLNGNSRERTNPLDTKYFTPELRLDANYT